MLQFLCHKFVSHFLFLYFLLSTILVPTSAPSLLSNCLIFKASNSFKPKDLRHWAMSHMTWAPSLCLGVTTEYSDSLTGPVYNGSAVFLPHVGRLSSLAAGWGWDVGWHWVQRCRRVVGHSIGLSWRNLRHCCRHVRSAGWAEVALNTREGTLQFSFNNGWEHK